MHFTQEQKDLLIGTLLGDGNMTTATKGCTWYYSAFQSFKQKEYLFYKYELLKNICNVEPQLIHKTNGRSDKLHQGYKFKTKTLDSLRFYGNMFYKLDNTTKKFIRCIPGNIEKFLTAQAIAY